MEPDPLSSEFAPDVYERFVDSPKPKQMYINAREFAEKGPRLYVDVIRCRYSALYKNIYPIPVFSPQDTIQPVTPGQPPQVCTKGLQTAPKGLQVFAKG